MTADAHTAPPGVHLVFSDTTPEPAASARYKQRFGREPQIIIRVNRQLWLGPVPKEILKP